MRLLFSKQNYNVLSPNSYTHISVKDLYISRIGLSILLQKKYVDRSWECMGIGIEAAQILFLGIHKYDFRYSVVKDRHSQQGLSLVDEIYLPSVHEI
jgi:hypothetical protein